MPRPTLNDIARHLGVSKMSVSRALRGERHVAEELRQRVKTAAEALNYRPDPEITKLMTHMRGARGQVAAQTLGVVWADKKPGAVAASPWSRELAAGMHERARQLGFQVDQVYLDEAGMNPRRLAEILEARGIDGFILSPLLSRSRGHISMPWERFSSVVIGLGYARPALNRVHHHHYLGMMTAMRRLKRLGYRRIGFFGPAVVNERMFGAWSASFITHHPLPALEALDLLCLRKVASRAELTAWLQKAQP